MRTLLPRLIAAAIVIWIFPLSFASATVVFTADTEGHVAPCSTCPHHTGLGGLDRRGVALDDIRKKEPVLLLDAGNFLFGLESLGSDGAVIVAAYNALGYDAVNLSHKDLRLGKEATVALLKQAKFAPVSANIVDDATGKPLFEPMVVKEIAGQKVAVLGVSEPPAGMKILPHLKRQLQGITIRPVADTLTEWLPKAQAAAPKLVLLYHGTPAGAQAAARQAGKDVSLIAVGGFRGDLLPPTPGVVTTSEHGKHLAVTDLAKGQTEQVPVDAENVPAESAVAAAIAPFLKPAETPAATQAAAPKIEPSATQPVDQPAAGPPALAVGKTHPLNVTADNKAIRLNAKSIAVLPKYGEITAEPGRSLAVLSTEWTNIREPITIKKDGKDVPTPAGYKLPDLNNHAYLVVDGKYLVRLHPKARGLPGHVPVLGFYLEDTGSVIRGNLVFDLPSDRVHAVELYVFDLIHDPIVSLLVGTPSKVEPIERPQKNTMLSAAPFGVRRDKTLGGRTAPDGMTFVTVDCRAESVFEMVIDGSQIDPSGKTGRERRPSVADWGDARTYISLVLDGEYGYLSEADLSTMPKTPRFVPGVMTGGDLVFLVPDNADWMKLRLDFPRARVGDQEFNPRGFDLNLEGRVIHRDPRSAIVEIDDEMFDVRIVGQRVADSFAGVRPAGGRFLVLDVEVRNQSADGEFFQPTKQFKLVTEQGRKLPAADATFAGPYRPTEPQWIPENARRTFQLVYEVPDTLAKPRLAYSGVSLGKTVDLNSIAGPGGPAAPATQPTTQPARPAVAGVTPPAEPPRATGVVRRPQSTLPRRVPVMQQRKPLGIAGVGLTPEQVNQAIDKGAEALWKLMEPDMAQFDGPNHPERHALVLLALVHADYHRKNPACDAAVRDLLANVDPIKYGTYGTGLFLMLAESYGDPVYLPQVRRATRYLVESQGTGGTWTYSGNRDKAIYDTEAPDSGEPLQILGGRPLEGPGSMDEPIARATELDPKYDGDNSVTQYAILGLHSAARMGVPVDRAVWQRTRDAMQTRQRDDGGWAYNATGGTYGSMTCAGVATLALCRHYLGEEQPVVHEGVEKAVGWLDEKFAVRSNPENSDTWLYYYLYGVERAGRILDTEYFGEHEWYPYGAKFLVGAQNSSWLWSHKYEEKKPEVASSFALLFLTRATPSIKIEQKQGPGMLRTVVKMPPAVRIYFILDASGSMLAEINGRPKFAIAQDAVTTLINGLPENAEVALRVYGHRKTALDKDADKDTELLVPMQSSTRQS